MNLEEAVDLVTHAFQHANTGDIMVQKSPASTVGDLARALIELFEVDNEIKVIGTRHGEKHYETLLTKEEFATSEDMGNYFRVPADARDLNYAQYMEEGKNELSEGEEYNSRNTRQLNIEEIKETLLGLSYVRKELEKFKARHTTR